MTDESLHPRHRKMKLGAALRSLQYESDLASRHLGFAITVDPNLSGKAPISIMKGVYRYGYDAAVEKARELVGLGIPVLWLLATATHRDAMASHAWAEDGTMCEVARRIKAAVGDKLALVGDCYLGDYTDHTIGGILDSAGRIMDGPTREVLGKTAVAWARSGIDIFCCSTMVDGRVAAIRRALAQAEIEDMLVMGAVKFNTSYFISGAAASSANPGTGYDKSTFYIDPANMGDAMRVARTDVSQGAEMLMVYPGYPFMDVITRLAQAFDVPVATFSVSGEYAMLANAVEHTNLQDQACVMELHRAYRRAGARLVVSYWAPSIASWMARA